MHYSIWKDQGPVKFLVAIHFRRLYSHPALLRADWTAAVGPLLDCACALEDRYLLFCCDPNDSFGLRQGGEPSEVRRMCLGRAAPFGTRPCCDTIPPNLDSGGRGGRKVKHGGDEGETPGARDHEPL